MWNIETWWWKANPKDYESLPAPGSIMVCFAHLLISEDLDNHQNLITS